MSPTYLQCFHSPLFTRPGPRPDDPLLRNDLFSSVSASMKRLHVLFDVSTATTTDLTQVSHPLASVGIHRVTVTVVSLHKKLGLV